MNFRRIYQNFFIAALSRLLTALIGLVIIGVLTRELGQTGYGAYETVLSYLFIFTVLADFGLHVVHVREISRLPAKALPGLRSRSCFGGVGAQAGHGPEERFISGNIFTLRLVLVLLTVLAAALVAAFLPYPAEVKNGIIIASAFVVFSSLSQILAGIFQKHENFYFVSASDLVSRLVQMALVIWAAKNNHGMVSFLAILSLSAGLQFGIILSLSRRLVDFRLGIDWDYAKRILKSSLPIALSILFTAIYIRTDALMLSLMKPAADVGIYRLPAKLLETLVFFPALLVELAMPSFSYLAFRAKDQFYAAYWKIFNFLLAIAVPVVALLYFFAEEVVVILGGSEFAASAGPLRILSLVIGLVFLNNLNGKVLITLDLQKKGVIVYLSGAVLNIVLNFIFITKYSYIGASLTTLVTEVIVTVWMFGILFREKTI